LLGWLSAMKAMASAPCRTMRRGRVVHHLAGHREELELHFEGAGGEHQGKGVEEEGAVVGRVQGHQVTAELRLMRW